MYRRSFPKCTIEGSLEPASFGHMVLSGSVPKKCTDCKSLFEGSCVRALEIVEDYLQLDYGSCPVQGETSPVEKIAGEYNCIYFVPIKCNKCEFLTYDDIRGFICGYQKDIWKDFPRTLDWGAWSPKFTPMSIEGKVTSTDYVTDLVLKGNKAAAVKELQRIYPPLTLDAAMKCVGIFSEKISS